MKSSTKQQANFFISSVTLKELRKFVSIRKQSEFVELAILKELQQRKFFAVLESSKGAWKKKDHTASTERFIRSLRECNRI